MRTILVLLCSGGLWAQESPVFRANVSMVHVDAEVSLEGRIINGLGKGDFRVKDEGKEQAIVQFAAEEQPLDIILLFDISGSMAPAVSSVAAATREALAELRQGDRVGVMVFSFRSHLVQPLSGDFDLAERSIGEVVRMKFRGGTLIQNGMDAAARYLMTQPRDERRRAVLIITDNVGQRTRTTSSVVRDFWEADALLSGLLVGRQIPTVAKVMGPVFAPQMALLRVGIGGVAGKTGGDAIRADDPGTAFRDMVRRIRNRYSLYYLQPQSKPGASRTIRVELADKAAKQYPKARVRARTGYTTPREKDITPSGKQPKSGKL